MHTISLKMQTLISVLSYPVFVLCDGTNIFPISGVIMMVGWLQGKKILDMFTIGVRYVFNQLVQQRQMLL